MVILKIHGNTKFLILDFLFLKYVFFVFIFDAIFYGKTFFIFQDSEWLVTHPDVFSVVPFIKSTGLAINADANLRCVDFLSEKSCRHSPGSFSFFLVLATRHSLSFHKIERQSCLFGVANALFTC